MSFRILKCPVCGASGVETKSDGKYFCPYCATGFSDDAAEIALKKIADSIDARVGSLVDEKLRADKEERFYNLRSNLWEKIHAKYIDSDSIVSICRDIKKIEPHDFLADFFEVANSASAAEVADYVNKINVRDNGIYIELVINFMINSLTSELIAPTNYLIERAYRASDLLKFEKYITKLETEAKKVDSGLYETMIPRDVFIAYSSKDMDKVLEIMRILEENGLSCFVAMRNLQHGRGAVANYERALREAIDNSKILVFVSSKNSRNFQCDAFKKELSYIRQSEISAAPPQYRNSYANLPARYKKPRIEYRLDNERTIAADRFMKEFFAGLDYCESPEKVVMRAADIIMSESTFADEEAERLAREEEERRKREESDRKTREQIEAMRAEMEAERRARAEAEAKSREISERRDKEEAERRKREEDERKLREKEQLDAMRAMLEAQRLEKERSAPKTEAEASAVHSPMPKADSRDIEAPSVKSASGKYCKTCGSLNAEGAKFCFSCSGTEFSQSAVKYCVSCEHTNPINAKFCDSCGGKDFAFTSDELREKISAKRAKEEAERIARYYVIDNGTLKTLKDKNIRAADIPKNVTAIAKNVFADCKMLESVIIPEGVTSIGYEAFARCEKLTEIVIPSSVKTIEARAFAVCKSLTKATLPEGLTELDSTFCDSAALSEVNIPSTVKRINRAFENCHSLKRIKLPAGLEHIGKSAFENCTSLEECNLPEGLKSIGYRAFFASSKLKEMRLPNSLTELGEFSFERTSIQNVTVPKGIKVIPTKCFGDCPNLESVRILGAETIKGQAFAGSARLRSLELSDTLKCIENLAFLGCSALSDVRFVPNPSRELKIDINAFKDCNKLSDSAKAQIMKNVNADGRVPFAVSGTKVTGLKPEYAFLTDITIPSDITEIGMCAFKDCANIVSVVIEEGVKTIGIDAFRHCDNLKSIRIPASVTSISLNAFDECPRLESIVIDSKNTKYAMIDKCLVEDYTSTRNSVLLRGLRGFKIPSTVATIASNAFLNTEAEKVVIPRLVNTLWAHAFGGCNKLSYVSFECTEGWVDTGKKLFGKISSKMLANPFQAAELLKMQENAWERK